MNGFFRVPERLHLAMILMADLARMHETQTRMSLQEVSERMHVSQGYLEEIASALKHAGLIEGRTGPRGGYRLSKHPSDIGMNEIVCALEGPVDLVECHGAVCPVSHLCSSKKMWDFLREAIQTSLKAKRLTDIC